MNKEVTLPVELVTCGLTLNEIGAIFVMFSYNKIDEEDRAVWSVDYEYQDVVSDLFEQEIMTHKDGEICIDITKMVKGPFWEILSRDANGNITYVHNSLYTGTIYTIRPTLLENRIQWILDHTDSSDLGGFDSMEEAEAWVRNCLKDEWTEIQKTIKTYE